MMSNVEQVKAPFRVATHPVRPNKRRNIMGTSKPLHGHPRVLDTPACGKTKCCRCSSPLNSAESGSGRSIGSEFKTKKRPAGKLMSLSDSSGPHQSRLIPISVKIRKETARGTCPLTAALLRRSTKSQFVRDYINEWAKGLWDNHVTSLCCCLPSNPLCQATSK